MNTLPTIKDIKNSKPSTDLIYLRRKVEYKIKEARTLKEYNNLEKMKKAIDSVLKY